MSQLRQARSTEPGETSRPGLDVLYPGPTDPEKVEIDIIAVHGLGSNVDWSWIWQSENKSRQVHWLRDLDMLPAILPNANVLAFNYPSNWLFDAPKSRLELYGEEFIRILHNYRTNRNRPVIFVAHSFGGLVVMHALLYAHRKSEFKYLPARTVGFTPLGTPFRGTNMQVIAKLLASLMKHQGSHGGIISELAQGNKHLADAVYAFCELMNSLDIPITCFFELYESDYGKRIGFLGSIRGMVVEEDSAHIPCWKRVSLYTDHFKLNKYASPNDRSFQAVSGELKRMYDGWKDLMKKREREEPRRHFKVPFGRNSQFVGRGRILERLLELIPPSVNKDDCQRTAIEGLGGTGKTQIALEVAYLVQEKYPACSIFWVPAIDLTSFENAYRDIGLQLKLPGINDEKGDVKRVVRQGLSSDEAGSWLLIIDNADDEILFEREKLVNYLPHNSQGSVLLTTRNHAIARQFDITEEHLIELGHMENDEASQLLRTGLKESQIGSTEDVDRLLNFLTHLPLAIRQASAYMNLNRTVTVSEYLKYCESSNADLVYLLSHEFKDRHRYSDDTKTRNAIAATWLISFEQISQRNPQAADYLKFLSVLVEKDIPESLLPGARAITKTEAINTLMAYGFIAKRDTQDSFDMHRLVHLAMRIWLQQKEEWSQWTTIVVQRLAQEYPHADYKTKNIRARYLPHAQAVLDNSSGSATEEYRLLLFKTAQSYFNLVNFKKAETLYRQTLQLSELIPGKLDDDIACIARSEHVMCLNQLRKYPEAEKQIRHVLELHERQLDKEHFQILRDRHDLSNCLYHQGRFGEAEQLQRQTLELQMKVLGEKDLDTLDSICQLAFILNHQSRYDEAETLMQQAWKLHIEVRGKEDGATLACMFYLCVSLVGLRKYDEAEKLALETIELQKTVLGKEHPGTLVTMCVLSNILLHLRKHEEAERLALETMELRKTMVGNEHPDTLGLMRVISNILLHLRKYEEAEKLALETTELRKTVLGNEHPDTPDSMHILVLHLLDGEKYQEGVRFGQQALELRKAQSIMNLDKATCMHKLGFTPEN
ncbi:hypothetical protein GGS21DRAFT_492114 [Xylaria nigripes]|nr:hypothetical protein GGS21DRAFT_492114 [Xylaria nigripes]